MNNKQEEKKEQEEKKGLGSFLRDCRSEFSKISWPSRKELVESTWVIAAMLLLVAVFVLLCDKVLQGIVNFLVIR
ncbi:MAG: preprotein translocase subunit SecE [Kiritimatiellae bacterium]|nr:preprotein translocase subunit SecE [Kiritimatiellia bacterium]